MTEKDRKILEQTDGELEYIVYIRGLRSGNMHKDEGIKNIRYCANAVIGFVKPEGWNAKAYWNGRMLLDEYIEQAKVQVYINKSLMPEDYTIDDLTDDYGDGFEFILMDKTERNDTWGKP